MGPAQSAIKGGDVAVYDSFAVKSPCGGIDAPITARAVGLPPRGGKYFLSKRKKVPKKARGTATPGKRLLLPILPAGLAMSRAI